MKKYIFRFKHNPEIISIPLMKLFYVRKTWVQCVFFGNTFYFIFFIPNSFVFFFCIKWVWNGNTRFHQLQTLTQMLPITAFLSPLVSSIQHQCIGDCYIGRAAGCQCRYHNAETINRNGCWLKVSICEYFTH